MQNGKVDSVTPSVEAVAGSVNLRKLQSLRLEKQTIRTLIGAELKLVGGGCHVGCSVSHPTLTL